MAKIIAVAGVRLTVSGKGLAAEMRGVLMASLKEASAGVKADTTKPIRDDVDKTSRHVRDVLGKILKTTGGVAAGFGRVVSSGLRMALIATAAGGALAGVASLTTGVIALGQALVAASGAALLLPAALAGLKAVTATVKIGLVGLDDAMKALGKDSAEFEEAIKDLAPEAQRFMRTLRQLKPAFDGLRMDVQNRLFLGLADHLKVLTDRYLPVAERLFVTMAGSINEAAKDVGTFLARSSTVQQVNGIVDNLRLSFAQMAPAILPAVQALLDLTDVGSGLMPELTTGINAAAQRFAAFIRESARTGELEAIIRRAIETIKQLGRIVANVFGTIGNVMDASTASGFGLLDNLEKITRAARDFSGSFAGQAMISGFFAQLKRVADALWPSVKALVEVFVRDFVPILADIAATIGPVLRPLFEALGRLLQSLRPLLQALADAFATVLKAMEPVFDALGDAIEDAMPELRPLIDDIAEAFANLVKAMIPLIPVFVDLLKAVLPVLPPFIQMVADLMPSLIDLIKAGMPLIEAFANAFVAAIPVLSGIVQFLASVLIPAFSSIITVLSGIINFLVGFGQTFWSIVTTVFTSVATAIRATWNGVLTFFSQILPNLLGKVRDWVTGVLRAIGQWGIDLFAKAKSAMSQFVSAIGTGIGNAVQWFKDLPGKVFSAIGDFIGKLVQLGKDLINGLIDGIVDAAKGVIDAVTGTITDALDAAKALLGIKSPSRVFHDIGTDTVQGLINGIRDMSPDAAAASAAMAQQVADAASGIVLDPTLGINPAALSGAGAAVGGAAAAAAGGVALYQTNLMQPGADVTQFASQVYREGARVLAAAGSTLGVSQQSVQAGMSGPGFVAGVRV